MGAVTAGAAVEHDGFQAFQGPAVGPLLFKGLNPPIFQLEDRLDAQHAPQQGGSSANPTAASKIL